MKNPQHTGLGLMLSMVLAVAWTAVAGENVQPGQSPSAPQGVTSMESRQAEPAESSGGQVAATNGLAGVAVGGEESPPEAALKGQEVGEATSGEAGEAESTAAAAQAEGGLPPAEEAASSGEELIELQVEKGRPAGAELATSVERKDLITISLDNVPLQDVVRMFTRISGANIVAGTNLQGKVTVSLQDVEWEPALRVILDSVDMAMVEKAPGIYVIMSKDDLASEPVTVDTVFLKYTTVSNILPIVRRMLVSTNASVAGFPSANSLVIQETANRLGRIKETIAKLDVPRPQVFIEAKFVELNDQAIKDLGINWQVLSGYTIGVRGLRYGYARGRTSKKGTQETSTRVNTEGAGTHYTDSDIDKREDLYQDASIDSAYGSSAFALLNGVPTMLYQSGTFNADVSGHNISEFDASKGTITMVPARDHTREISRVDENYNTHASENRRAVSDDVLTTTEELLSAILTADDFAITLSALKQHSGVDIVSNPRIIVASGETATIHVGVREPNIQAKPQGDSGNTYVYGLDSAQQFFDVGVMLAVTPTVNTKDRISVKITPELSRLLTPAKVEQVGVEFPRIQTRKIETEFNLASGRTVAIGGLTQTADRQEVTKVPLLGDIPIIGKYLFRHTHTAAEQDEVIIFVTVGLAEPKDLTDISGVPSGGKLIHEHLAREALQAQQ